MNEHIRRKLASSGITDKFGDLMGLSMTSAKEMKDLGLPAQEAIRIPYHTIDGKPDGDYARWRFTHAIERTTKDKDGKTITKRQRYAQEPGSPIKAYLPPCVKWQSVIADPTQRVIITEGEFKAVSASAHIGPTIGLGGVWAFRDGDRLLLPELESFVWAGRQTVVCYDSDSSTNVHVMKARRALCEVLCALGAQVSIAHIPSDADHKMGIDDYIVEVGADEARYIIDLADSYRIAKDLHAMNDIVVYVADPSLVIRLADGLEMAPNKFVNEVYANRFTEIEVFSSDGRMTMKRAPLAREWLKWPLRFEMRGIQYAPGMPRFTEDGYYNHWRGMGTTPEEGDVTPWSDLLEHLFTGESEAARSWFERWLAFPLQNPGAKMFTAAVIWSRYMGTGKSLIGTTMSRIYGRNYAVIGDDELNDERFEWAINKQFVMGDDISSQGVRSLAEKLRRMITQEEMRVNKKFLPSYTVKDRINYYFTSNNPDAFHVDEQDRRYFIHEATQPERDRAFYIRYMDWLENGGAQHLYHHLLHLDLDGMRASDRAPSTQSKRAMIDDGMSELARWVHELRDAPDAVLRIDDAPLPGDLWSAADLFKLFEYAHPNTRVTQNGLSRELRRAGIPMAGNGEKLRMPDGTMRVLFVSRNVTAWRGEKDKGPILRHYETHRGKKGKF